jgi:hypothetical protein
MKKHNCEECKMRAKYDNASKSFVGKFWRWHINFCPGWKGYMLSLDDDKKAVLTDRYKLN